MRGKIGAMRYLAWMGSNLAAALAAPLAVFGLSAAMPSEWGILIIYPGSGAIVGLIQWTVLARCFGLRSWWWIPATALGLVSSVYFSWWFLLAPGLTSGLAQYALVKRRWPILAELWVAASTVGWVAGMLAVGLGGIAGSPWEFMVAMAVSGLLYGAATAPVLALLERFNPPVPAPMSATGKLALALACTVSLVVCATGAWVCARILLSERMG